MRYKKPDNISAANRSPQNPLRRSNDTQTTRQAEQFPGIGITLGSYKHNPFAGAATLPRFTLEPAREPGRFRSFWTRKRIIIVAILILLTPGLWLGGKLAYNANKLFRGNILGVLSTTKLKGEDSGRVNILLAGNSADDAGHSGGDLTDSIMIMSINTKTYEAFLLSVPRDLYIQLPGSSGHSKINYAYVAGKNNEFSQDGYPAGGMGELENVISRKFDIDINYYALVNYTALKQAVDAVGGIDITVKSSDPRGLYDPNIDYTTKGPLVKLTNGPHHLNGQQALDLARARGDSYYSYGFAASDFARTNNQRDMLVALKTKAVSAGVLSNPAKLSNLADAIGGNVKTDFSISEVKRLYELAKKTPGTGIESYSLNSAYGKNLLASYTSPSGESTLIPAAGIDDFSGIQAFMDRIMSNDPVVREGARIVVLNATNTPGIAAKQRLNLQSKHLNVIDIGNANPQPSTSIIQTKAGKATGTLQLLQKQYGKTAVVTTTNPYAGVYDADFIILVGIDQVPAPASATGSGASGATSSGSSTSTQ